MRFTAQLLQHTSRITLFTRSNCGLCSSAKSVLENVAKKRSFDYLEVDVMAVGQEKFKNLYEFDTPVVRDPFLVQINPKADNDKLYAQRVIGIYSQPDIATESRQLMHRFTEDQVERLLDKCEGQT